MVATGLAAYALDLRGRGKSDGERFYVEKFGDYVSDVATLVGLVKSRKPGLPVFLLGHSAGGVVACLYTVEHQAELAGLICESFAFQVPAPNFALAVFKGLSHVAPHAHVLHLKNEDFSRDSNVVEAMNADRSSPTRRSRRRLWRRWSADERLKGIPAHDAATAHPAAPQAGWTEQSQFFHETAGSRTER